MRDFVRKVLEEEIVTTEEAAVIMNRYPSDIRRMVNTGRIESIKKGHTNLIDKEDLWTS